MRALQPVKARVLVVPSVFIVLVTSAPLLHFKPERGLSHFILLFDFLTHPALFRLVLASSLTLKLRPTVTLNSLLDHVWRSEFNT